MEATPIPIAAAADHHEWDMQAGEPPRAFQAFCRYRDMGPTRSTRQASISHYGQGGERRSKIRQVQKWCKSWTWVARAQAFDNAETARLSDALSKERDKSRKDRLMMSRLAMKRALEKLKATPGESIEVDEAIKLLEMGMRNERLDLGEATERVDEGGGVFVYLPDNGTGKQQPAEDQAPTEGA